MSKADGTALLKIGINPRCYLVIELISKTYAFPFLYVTKVSSASSDTFMSSRYQTTVVCDGFESAVQAKSTVSPSQAATVVGKTVSKGASV